MKNLFSISHLLIISFLLVFTFISCSDDDNPTAPAGTDYTGEYGTVTGKFTAPNGTGISGVVVSVVSQYSNMTTVTTDSLGNFIHTKVPTGSVTLQGKKGSFTAAVTATVSAGGITPAATAVIQPQNKMAVVLGTFDSIEEIIKDLGYPFDTLEVEDLSDPAKLNINRYSAVFLNCGITEDEATANLMKFVKDGGLMYASDWATSYVESMYPGNFSILRDGDSQEIEATVTDELLKKNLGKSVIHIVYDLGSWAEIDQVNTSMFTEIIRGTYTSAGVTKTNRPLAVYRKEGNGVIVSTTFHNEANATADMVEILQEFIFF